MVDQNTFLDTLNSVKDIITTSATPLKEEEILSYFQDMELDNSQKTMVLDYLTNPDNYKEIQEEDNQTTQNKFDNAKREVNVYQLYLDEIEELESYTADDLDGFYRMLLQGDNSVIEKISHAWLLRITDLAKQYMEGGFLLEDLVQEGNMALFLELSRLCGSMEKIDVEETLNRAVEEGIVAYAAEMRDAKEMEDSIVGKVNLVNAACSIWKEEHGKDPTLKELSEYTKMSEQELESIQEIMDDAKK